LYLDRNTEKNAAESGKASANAAGQQPPSTGAAGADSVSARPACWKISGGCRVTELPGNARIAAVITDLATSS